jgi:hypothetical protein
MNLCAILLLSLLGIACSAIGLGKVPNPDEQAAHQGWVSEIQKTTTQLAKDVAIVTNRDPGKAEAYGGLAAGLAALLGLGLQVRKQAADSKIGDADHDANVAKLADLEKQIAILKAGKIVS